MVYDVVDTDGSPLPEWFNETFEVIGDFDSLIFERTVENCYPHYRIRVAENEMGLTHGGTAKRIRIDSDTKIIIEIKAQLDLKAKYEIICHELAHVFLGHLGSDRDNWWPSRLNLTRSQKELEAESVAYIVCKRAGLETKSAEYLTGYMGSDSDLANISIDLIAKVSGRIENMGTRKFSERSPKEVEH